MQAELIIEFRKIVVPLGTVLIVVPEDFLNFGGPFVTLQLKGKLTASFQSLVP